MTGWRGFWGSEGDNARREGTSHDSQPVAPAPQPLLDSDHLNSQGVSGNLWLSSWGHIGP